MLERTMLALAALLATQQPESAPRNYYVPDVLAHISRQSGVAVVSDSTLKNERVPMPAASDKITPENVETYIARVVRAIPGGARWARLLLPPPPSGREYRGDDLVAFALAQARLFGTAVGGDTPEGTVEILSQRISAEKARPALEALRLKPVYVLTAGRGTFSGRWNATFGEMALHQSGRRVTGSYTFSDGVIEGVVTGDVLRFRWLERETGGKGAGKFVLSEDGESFTGSWSYTDDPDAAGSSWTGQRISRSTGPLLPAGRPAPRNPQIDGFLLQR